VKWAVKKWLDATGGHVFCRISEAVLSCCNGLREMKRLILDENPVAILYLQRSEDLQAHPRDPEERLTEDRAREELEAMIRVSQRSDEVEACATG
jgi:hypothetical protein